jgi:DNA recombination-dependent growth factor C
VIGRRKPLSLKELNQEFNRFRLKPFRLRPSRRELEYGWDIPASLSEAETTPEHWDLSDCRLDEGFWLRVRLEKRKVPTQLVNLVAKEKVDQAQQEREGKPVGRKLRKAILDETREELLEQTLPTISFFEGLWKDEADVVYLFTTSKSNCAVFEELFRESFGKHLDLRLVKMTPPLLGLSPQEWQGKNDHIPRLDQLEGTLPEPVSSLS